MHTYVTNGVQCYQSSKNRIKLIILNAYQNALKFFYAFASTRKRRIICTIALPLSIILIALAILIVIIAYGYKYNRILNSCIISIDALKLSLEKDLEHNMQLQTMVQDSKTCTNNELQKHYGSKLDLPPSSGKHRTVLLSQKHVVNRQKRTCATLILTQCSKINHSKKHNITTNGVFKIRCSHAPNGALYLVLLVYLENQTTIDIISTPLTKKAMKQVLEKLFNSNFVSTLLNENSISKGEQFTIFAQDLGMEQPYLKLFVKHILQHFSQTQYKSRISTLTEDRHPDRVMKLDRTNHCLIFEFKKQPCNHPAITIEFIECNIEKHHHSDNNPLNKVVATLSIPRSTSFHTYDIKNDKTISVL